MAVSKIVRNPLWATLVGALVSAMVVSFVVFVQSGEAVPRAAADEQPSSASVVSPMIIGGTEVPAGKYPFMAAILDKRRPGGAFDELLCTGTLIDKNSVLTAAHCLHKPNGVLDRGIRLQVTVGRTDVSKNQGQIRSVSLRHTYFHYRYKGNVYDVAVLKLRRPVKGIKPIKLATAKQNNLEKPGNILTAAGWGSVKQGPGIKEIWPKRMHEVSIPVVSDARAKRAYQGTYFKYFPSLEVAAGKKGKGPCHGDSGGPLFDPGSRTQVGITTHYWGKDRQNPKCASARYPMNFTEINNPKIRNFIVWAAKQ
jgi:secreted trypsin-like serine protease